eukprot:1619779-Prymnesium_polylepis.1
MGDARATPRAMRVRHHGRCTRDATGNAHATPRAMRARHRGRCVYARTWMSSHARECPPRGGALPCLALALEPVPASAHAFERPGQR